MNSKIIICLNPFISHFLPVITLVKFLGERGFEVKILGFDSLKKSVMAEGFEYISIPDYYLNNLQKMKNEKKYKQMEPVYKKLHAFIYEIFKQENAKYIMMGISRFHWYLIPALKCNCNIYLYSLCGGVPYINLKAPPMTSDYLPGKKTDMIISSINWYSRWKKKGKLNVEVKKELNFYPWNEMRYLCKEQGRKWKFGLDGYFPDYPVLVFGSRHLEIYTPQDIEKKGIYYLGLGVDRRSYNKVDFKGASKKLIYCSFGTMNERYENVELFIRELLNVFKIKTEWKLIISVGTNTNVLIDDIPDNVIIKHYVPQLDILTSADLVITHGGHNSIKECLFFKVPMIVLPCMYDQRGNAVKVEYHNIGIRNLMLESSITERNSINYKKIMIMMEKIFGNHMYKENIEDLSNRIKNSNELEKSCNILFV